MLYIPFGVDTLWMSANCWLCYPRPVRSELKTHGEGTGFDTGFGLSEERCSRTPSAPARSINILYIPRVLFDCFGNCFKLSRLFEIHRRFTQAYHFLVLRCVYWVL